MALEGRYQLSCSSRGLGHRPLTAVTGVRIPYGTPNNFKDLVQKLRSIRLSSPELFSFLSRKPLLAPLVVVRAGLTPPGGAGCRQGMEGRRRFAQSDSARVRPSTAIKRALRTGGRMVLWLALGAVRVSSASTIRGELTMRQASFQAMSPAGLAIDAVATEADRLLSMALMPCRMQGTTCPLWSQFSAAGLDLVACAQDDKLGPEYPATERRPGFSYRRGPEAGCRRGAGPLVVGE
jgi:hypothetical protein